MKRLNWSVSCSFKTSRSWLKILIQDHDWKIEEILKIVIRESQSKNRHPPRGNVNHVGQRRLSLTFKSTWNFRVWQWKKTYKNVLWCYKVAIIFLFFFICCSLKAKSYRQWNQLKKNIKETDLNRCRFLLGN